MTLARQTSPGRAVEDSFVSNASVSSVRGDQVALSFTDPNVSRPVDLAAEVARHQSFPPRPMLIKLAVVGICLYCSPSVALWQQAYKTGQMSGGGEGCEYLWRTKVEASFVRNAELQAAAFAVTERRLNAEVLPWHDRKHGSGDWTEALVGFFGVRMVKTSPESVGPGETFFDRSLNHPTCPWYLVEVARAAPQRFTYQDKEVQYCGGGAQTSEEACQAKPGCRFVPASEGASGGCFLTDCNSERGGVCYMRVSHSYQKGLSLFIISGLALLVHWFWAYQLGGLPLLMSCFDWTKMHRFAIIGALFGFSAVFGFIGQALLTPATYMIIGQSSIVLVPVLWRMVFRTPIPTLSWLHILMTAFGMFTYFTADLDLGGAEGSAKEATLHQTLTGLFCALMKVLMSGMGAVMSDLYLKTLNDIPFPVQVSYILPFKALAALAFDFLCPPHRFAPSDIRSGGAFHDMSFGVVLVLVHSLGDTIVTGVVVNVFDAVAKAIIAVMSIIFPTWVVSYTLGWDEIEFGSIEGRLKITGAVIVVASAVAYTLGRSQARQLALTADRLATLESRQRALAASPTDRRLTSSLEKIDDENSGDVEMPTVEAGKHTKAGCIR